MDASHAAAVPAVAIRNAVKHFGNLEAVRGIDLVIEQGEFFGLLGPNGAGKSTVINMLAGLVRPTSGTLQIAGFDVQKDYRRARRALGVVPQELVYDPFFSVRELLKIQSGYFGVGNNGPWIDEILHNLGLSDKANVNMRALSGGMKRRVLVAQALVHKPQVIVLDEPTAGVDVELRQTLWDFIRKLNRDGHTIVLTTHYLEEAESLCGRIAMLKNGRVVALDQTQNLLKTLNDVYVKLSLTPHALPAALEPLISSVERNRYTLKLADYSALEHVLGTLRASGAHVDELQLIQPDLEDVFVQIMSKH